MSRRHVYLFFGSAFVFAAAVQIAGCSSSDSTQSGDDSSNDVDANAAGDDATSSDDASTNDTGSASDAGSTTDGGSVVDAGGIVAFDSGDGFGLLRAACLDEINKLRATEGHEPYALWSGSAIETCLDEQSTYDETEQVAHDAWNTSKYPTCNGNAQDECEGYPLTVAGITQCIDDMWNEKTKPNCAGCSAAACQKNYTPNCANCDYSGTKGYECGHYVNMSADWMVKGNCGFSTYTGSTKSGTHPFAAQNFSQ